MAPAAHWTPKEELALIEFLIENKAKAGDGCNFKAATFQKVTKAIAPLLHHGAVKTAKACGNKYCAVSPTLVDFIAA